MASVNIQNVWLQNNLNLVRAECIGPSRVSSTTESIIISQFNPLLIFFPYFFRGVESRLWFFFLHKERKRQISYIQYPESYKYPCTITEETRKYWSEKFVQANVTVEILKYLHCITNNSAFQKPMWVVLKQLGL